MKILFMIRYGEKEHLQNIVDGKIRFTPAQNYIELEKEQGLKGQGDKMEGKITLPSGKGTIISVNGKEQTLDNIEPILSLEDLDKMPIACFSAYGEDCTKDYINDGKYKISLPKKYLDPIRNDFWKASHALIILEPDRFIQNVFNLEKHEIIGELVQYFEQGQIVNKLMYLSTGNPRDQGEGQYSISRDGKYRALLCKDSYFKNQCEYRFICLDNLITSPEQYSFQFELQYMIVPIDNLDNLIQVYLEKSI